MTQQYIQGDELLIFSLLKLQYHGIIYINYINNHLASSSSSARVVPSLSNLDRHCCTSALALDRALWMSALASCSSSSCSRAPSRSAVRLRISPWIFWRFCKRKHDYFNQRKLLRWLIQEYYLCVIFTISHYNA